MRGLLVAALVAFAALPAAADPPAPPAGSPDRPTASALADQRALAERLSARSVAEALTGERMRVQVEALVPIFLRGNDDRAEEVRRIVSKEMLAEMDKTVPFLLEQGRDQLAGTFSASELRELIRFDESDVARKLVAALPGFQKEASALGVQLGRAAAQSAIPRIIDRLCAANLATPETL